MWSVKNNINTQNRNGLTHTENRMMTARGEGAGGLGGKGEGIKKYRLVVTNSPGDVKYSIGNTVYNTVITMCGVRGVLDLRGITS